MNSKERQKNGIPEILKIILSQQVRIRNTPLIDDNYHKSCSVTINPEIFLELIIRANREKYLNDLKIEDFKIFGCFQK